MIAAGFGCRARCSAAEICAAFELALRENGASVAEIGGVFSAELAAAPALREAATALGKPLVLLPWAALAAAADRALTRSARVLELFGLPSIAETAALAGALELAVAGAPGLPRLLSPRLVSGAATCALARAREET